LVELGNPEFIATLFGLCYVDEERLVWRACKCAEEVVKVLFACRARGYEIIRPLEVVG